MSELKTYWIEDIDGDLYAYDEEPGAGDFFAVMPYSDVREHFVPRVEHQQLKDDVKQHAEDARAKERESIASYIRALAFFDRLERQHSPALRGIATRIERGEHCEK